MHDFLEKVTDELYLVVGEHQGKFPLGSALLINSKYKVLVDTGFGPSRRDAVMSAFNIDIIINTHFHSDHTRENPHFKGVEFWAHYLDAPAITSAEVFYEYTSLNQLPRVPEGFRYVPSTENISRKLTDGEILDFGGISLEVVHTPGHTPGHISLFEPQKKILFSGDIDLSPFGPWYGDTTSDIDQFYSSINRVLALNPSMIISNHCGIITENIADKLIEYRNVIRERDDLILSQLKTSSSLADIFNEKIIYPFYPEPAAVYRHFERKMLEKHIIRLARKGKIVFKSS